MHVISNKEFYLIIVQNNYVIINGMDGRIDQKSKFCYNAIMPDTLAGINKGL